jgi:hypothetical protein
VQGLPFVREVTPITVQLMAAGTPEPEFISTVLTQIGGREFIASGLTGKDVKVGVIDVGFYGLTTNRTLRHLLQEDRIKDVKDFITPSRTEHFNENETHSDYHGAEVLQMLTGYDPDRKMQYGLATGAHFYLARTDHGIREARTEEDNWIAAVERLDSLGVRLINTSLGYALGFTNPKENYKPSEMDGRTSKISRAAQVAVEEKGMLIVVSAGNEGDDARWRVVSTPADAQGVLSVGRHQVQVARQNELQQHRPRLPAVPEAQRVVLRPQRHFVRRAGDHGLCRLPHREKPGPDQPATHAHHRKIGAPLPVRQHVRGLRRARRPQGAGPGRRFDGNGQHVKEVRTKGNTTPIRSRSPTRRKPWCSTRKTRWSCSGRNSWWWTRASSPSAASPTKPARRWI